MSSVKKFKDLIAWKRAMMMRGSIYKISNSIKFASDFRLWGQIGRAARSILSTIVEGFERNGTRECINFLLVSKDPAGEIRSPLYTTFDLKCFSEIEFKNVFIESTSAKKIEGASPLFKKFQNERLRIYGRPIYLPIHLK